MEGSEERFREEPESSAEERYEFGRSGWDVVTGIGGWFKKWWRWLAVGLVALLCLVYVGWYSWSAFIVGLVFFFVLFKMVLRGEYVVVDVFDDSLNFDTLLIGKRRFMKLYKDGGLAKVQTSAGVPRYVCEGIDLEKGVLKSSWVASVSSLAFVVDMKAHKRVLLWLDEVIERFLVRIGYSTIVGKLKAKEILQGEFGYLDGKYAQLDSEMVGLPDVLHTELGVDVKDREEGKRSGSWEKVKE
jgi:hypothetical protein